jgi:hypothetical protein
VDTRGTSLPGKGGKEWADQGGHLLCMRFQCEMSGIYKMDLRTREVPLKGGCAGRHESRIVTAPDGKQWWLVLAKVGLEGWIERDIAAVVKDEIKLNLVRARPC